MTGLDEKIRAIKAGKNPGKHKSAKERANGKAVKRVPTVRKKADEQDELFAHAYVRHGCNGTKAYLEVFPNVKPESASVLGWKRLRKVNVQRILFPLLESLMEKNAVDTEWVLTRWLEQANGSPLDYFHITSDGELGDLDLNGISDAERRNLKTIKVNRTFIAGREGADDKINENITITVADQQHAVDMFAKYMRMLTEKMPEEDRDRIGNLIEQGVKRIRACKDLDAWRDIDIGGQFNDAV